MPLLILLALALAAGTATAVVVRRHPRRPPSLAVAERAGEAAAAHRGPRRLLAARLDPEQATGLALTAAVVIIVAGGVVLGALAYLVRSNSGVVRVDDSVARWGDRHATGFSTRVITAITDAGAPRTIAALALVLGIVLLVRTRRPAVGLFLLCVVGGNALITTAIKDLADRVRPSLNPIAETLGPSFPSGHSSHSAAFLAAAALLLGLGRSRPVRAALAGAAVGLAVAVAASRVLLDEHWLSDVVAGLALGWAWFAVCSIAFGGRLLDFGGAAEAAREPVTAEGRLRDQARAPAGMR